MERIKMVIPPHNLPLLPKLSHFHSQLMVLCSVWETNTDKCPLVVILPAAALKVTYNQTVPSQPLNIVSRSLLGHIPFYLFLQVILFIFWGDTRWSGVTPGSPTQDLASGGDWGTILDTGY